MTTIISKVRAEIERIMCEYEPFEGGIDETTGAHIALAKLLSFLDTLEEPVCHYGDVPSYERCVVCSANCSARVEEKSEKPNNHFYGIGAIRNGVQEKIDWFRSRPYFDEKSDYSKGFLDALVDMRSLVNRPDFDNPEGLDEAAREYARNIPQDSTKYLFCVTDFKAGAEWDREQMMKGAVDADVLLTLHDKTGDISLHTGYLPKELGIKYGDKVRVIIVKED